MDIDTFWQFIEDVRSGQGAPADPAAVAKSLVQILAARGEQEILAFEAVQQQVDGEGYRWDLWAAGYLINGGCSDDGFDYFRGWLLAQGREVWDRALAEPDSLAALFPDTDVDPYDYDGEEMLGVAHEAYETLTGDTEGFWTAVERWCESQGEPSPTRSDPAGELFDFEDDAEMRARLPRLSAIFLEGDD